MPFQPSRPSRIIRPSAKLHADNVGQQEITTHHSAVASAVAQCGLAQPQGPECGLPASLLPNDDPSSDNMCTPPDSAPAPSHKRPLACRQLSSLLSLSTVVSDPASDNDSDSPDDYANSKRAKMDGCGSSDDLDMHSDVQILDIDGVEDLRDESLNKSKQTADLKEFFYKMANLPDQKKVRMRCNLCA